jgi:predicted transposase YbfD/YdcC
MHLVHTYLVEERGLLLGMAPAEGAPGEASAAQGLLGLLELEATVVTGDANLLTKDVADTIVEKGGDYAMALKGNRGPSHAEVKEVLCLEGTKDVLDEKKAHSLCTSHHDSGKEEGHGREERRRAWAFDVKYFPRVQRYLPHAQCVLALLRERAPQEGTVGFKESRELHLYVSSRPPSEAEALAGYVRAHWAIENLLHRQLDVVLHEDASRIAKGPGAQNLATVRRVALAALKADTTYKASMPKKVRQAAHVDAYRTHLLTQVIS